MNQKSLVMISPHNWYDHVKPKRVNRPLKLVEQYYNGYLFEKTVVVNRLHPKRILKIEKENPVRNLISRTPFYNLYLDSKNEIYYLEHCLPFGKIESLVLPLLIKKLVKQLNLKNLALWVCDPKSAYMLDRLSFPSVFDAYDDWSLSPLFNRKKRHMKYILKGYKIAQDSADVIVTNTEYMQNKLQRVSGNVYVVSNTSSLKFQKINQSKSSNINKYKSIVGYIGNLHDRLDIKILEIMLKTFPDILFMFVGKKDFYSSSYNELFKKYENINLTGAVPYSLVPSYISQFDVCIVPHIVDNYTLSQDSMKIYDYLTYGKPIVSTNIPPTDNVSKFLYIANSPNEFVEKLKIALDEQNVSLKQERVRYMNDNSWRSKAEYIFSLLKEV